MRVWLIKDGENLPIDEKSRLQRMGLLANFLTQMGVEVIWWQSTFNHFRKIFRFREEKDIQVNSFLKLKLIHSVGYKKNVSIRRLFHHYDVAKQFYKKAKKEDKPDVILVAMPTIAFTYYATKFAKKYGIPIIVDIRDLNPDVYVSPFHGLLKLIVRIGIKPLQCCLRNSLKKADGIVGTTQPYLDWALCYAGRKQKENDRIFFVSYLDKGLPTKLTANSKWTSFQTGKFLTCCFYGQFGRLVDFDTIIQAAELCKKNNLLVRFILCGSGELLEYYKKVIADKKLDNVFLPGWVNQEDIRDISLISDLGLMAYHDDKNFNMQITNKFSEYLSFGLGVLLQPTGVMQEMIEKNACGVHFNDSTDLFKQLESLYNSPNKLNSMKRNARILFEREFVADKVYMEYAKYIIANAKTK